MDQFPLCVLGCIQLTPSGYYVMTRVCHLFKAAYTHYLPMTSNNLIEDIVEMDNDPLLEYIQVSGVKTDDKLLNICAFKGNMRMLQNAIDGGHVWDQTVRCNVHYMAILGGHLPMLKWLKKERCGYDVRAWEALYVNGSLENLKWFVKEGRLNVSAFVGMVKYDRLEMLQWGRYHRHCSWDDKVICCNAAYYGRLEILQWLKETGCKWDSRTCSHAAKGGHLNILKWVRENKGPWGEETCREAIKEDHVHILKWAILNGCPFNEQEAHAYATSSGNSNILTWIKQRNKQ